MADGRTSGLGAALGFLTVLPVGRDWPEGEPPDAVPWYPAVGWAAGTLGVGVVWGLDALGVSLVRNSFLVGALVVAVWALFTRFLHWDGLADTADGLLGSFDREARLRIMRDSRVGAFGATAVAATLLLQAGAVASLVSVGAWWPIVVAPVAGRAAVSLAAWMLPAARTEGLGLTVVTPGASLSARLVSSFAMLLVVVPIAADVMLGPAGWGVWEVVAVLVAMDVLALSVPRLLARGVGGMTGDLFGATVVLVETGTLVVAALVL